MAGVVALDVGRERGRARGLALRVPHAVVLAFGLDAVEPNDRPHARRRRVHLPHEGER